jgi:hypothetical protein
MREWFIRKSQNSRISMCIKEVTWELESSNNLHRAIVLAIAQLFREHALSESVPRAVLDNPFTHTRDQLIMYYVDIEDVRNLAAARLSDTQQGFKRLGMNLPQYATDHAKACNRGLEVWMCTIGAAVVPERRNDVQRARGHLKEAASQVPTAIAHLREVERKTGDGMFDGVTDDAWTTACRFFPSALVHRD